jgi:ParB-like chromosome segregation protein Spo0J
MQQIEFIPLEKLKLDNKNPRLPSNFNNKSENDIIEWMLEDESIIELMLAIGQHDFFVGEALLVVKNGDGFTVVEGNRRLTSLKLLSNPSLATIRVNKVKQVLEETTID